MTDEEKAINYTNNTHIRYNEILSHPEIVDEIRKAYLAGLEAGKDMAEADFATIAYMQGAERYKPKWHKVADGDLPKPNIAVLICFQFEKWTTTYIAYYRPAIKKWQMYNLSEAQRQPIDDDYIDSEEVIAWCEIPTFTDKE